MIKKHIALALMVNIVILLTGCGNNNSENQVSQSVSVDEVLPSTQENSNVYTTEGSEYVGMFYNEGELIIVREDGTLTSIELEKNSCNEGTYVQEGEQFHFIPDDPGLDDTYGIFDSKKWVIDEVTYSFTTETGYYLCEALGEGIKINSDGTFAAYKDFENKTGKVIGTYERDGCQWVFTSPGFVEGSKIGTFDGHNWTFGGDVYSHGSVSLESLSMPRYGIYIEGTSQSILGINVKKLPELGFKVKVDYEDVTVVPGGITEFNVLYNNATATLKAINVYEKDASLGECIICSFYTEDTSTTYQLDSLGNGCGMDNHDELLNYDVYEYTADKLVYKKYVMPAFNMDIGLSNDSKGQQIMEVTGDADITLRFDDMTLISFTIEFPELVYAGLDDNIDSETLASADMQTIEDAISIRNDILGELIDAFAETDIMVNINETSGEILMDNNVLFATDSYELTDAGKEYMDQFMSVYASVLLSEKFEDSVANMRFEGHTDSTGDFGYNQALSQKRANAVLEYCLNSTGNGLSDGEKERLSNVAIAQGYSYTDLIYDENGREDKKASRRVSIKFFIKVS